MVPAAWIKVSSIQRSISWQGKVSDGLCPGQANPAWIEFAPYQLVGVFLFSGVFGLGGGGRQLPERPLRCFAQLTLAPETLLKRNCHPKTLSIFSLESLV